MKTIGSNKKVNRVLVGKLVVDTYLKIMSFKNTLFDLANIIFHDMIYNRNIYKYFLLFTSVKYIVVSQLNVRL